MPCGTGNLRILQKYAVCSEELEAPRSFLRLLQKEAGLWRMQGSLREAHIVDAIAFRKAIEVIQQPNLIEAELEKRKIEDPTKGSLQAAETLLKKTVDSIINLTETLETTKDPGVREILVARMEELFSQEAGLRGQYDRLLRIRINWEDATRALDDFKKWCKEQRPIMDNTDYKPTYKERRDALEMIGIRVIVYSRGSQAALSD